MKKRITNQDMKHLEGRTREEKEIIVIGDLDDDLKAYYEERGLTIKHFASENDYHRQELERTSLGAHTRKSTVGAAYRVGASFTMDAIYLSIAAAASYYASENMEALESAAKGFSDFIGSLDPGKLMRVAGFVVGINFVDYKYDVTNRLDRATSKLESKITNVFRKN